MTLTQLEYVLAVNKHQHFGRAAESCFVTQPTLSMQLQKLEDQLQVTIFDRSKSPIQPTDEGRSIIEQAKVIIFEQNKLFSIIDESKGEVTGDFRLSVIPTLSPFIIPLFIQEFTTKFPRVNLMITENKTEEIIELLKSDEIDAGIIVTPLHEKSIIERVLYYEPFHLFVSPGHPLSKKTRIKEEFLDINEIWLLNKGNCFRDQALKLCQKRDPNGPKNPINFESGNFETLKNMVLKGSGYTLLPDMATKQLPAAQKKLLRPFIKPIPTREVSLVHSKHCVKIKVLDALEEEILSVVPDELRDFNPKAQEVIEIGRE
jgi:LysR family hydrogen peroxide-inducible transcriptional activator